MTAFDKSFNITAQEQPGDGGDARSFAAMPEYSPLDMTEQSLHRWSAADERPLKAPKLYIHPVLRRLLVFGGAFLLTAYGTYEMYQVVSVSRTTMLQWLLVALFTINFSWIALAFTSAILGFLVILFRRRLPALPTTLTGKTAVIMPVYNESTARVFAAIAVIRESLEASGLGQHFEYFLLSDSTDPDAWISEERAFLDLREQAGPGAKIYYRHRPKNHHRKAGNIADFVTRWGGNYDHMLVLDADSLMTGECIIRLTAAMEADPDSGIIQTLPLIINRNTFFARLQQFAARVYGPVIATGVSSWSGHDGNYWGHNAIIRVKAFAAHCGLPVLKGKPPFGGHILSHDFIEAALIRRAGWTVYSLTELTGSYEESPPSLIDMSVRDRRWCQGNLQHSRVLLAKGLKLPTRQHLATGIFAYLSSPFWLAQLLVGILLVWQSTYIRPEYFSPSFSLYPIWPRFDPERALALFAITMGILLAPKFMGIILTLLNGEERRACGGFFRLLLSSIIEIIVSALVAPVLTVIQSGSVFQVLFGRDSGWNPQRRDDGSIPWGDVVRRHKWHMVLGIVSGLSAFMISTSLFLWMSPTILGLVLAIPLSWLSGQLGLGLVLKRLGLLMTPEEAVPPPIAQQTMDAQERNERLIVDEKGALPALKADTALASAHLAMLPPQEVRPKGTINADFAVAEHKLEDAGSVEELARWIKPKEAMALLHNKALFQRFLALPAHSIAPPDKP